jgi:hypothetical protein
MEVAAISALVGAAVSFIAENFPQVKAWLATLPNWAVVLIFAALFYLVPLAVAFASCKGVVIPGVIAACPAASADVEALIANSTVAFLASQAWHGFVNKKLESAG